MTNQKSEPNPPTSLSTQAVNQTLTDKDRTALIDEIVKEMRKDLLKQEAGKKLDKLSWFFSQSAVLLVISFTLTGIVGAIITGRLQRAEWDRQKLVERQEWERQQTRLADIQGINLKYQIIDDVTKSVGERNAAALGIVVLLLGDKGDEELLKKEAEEPIKNWEKVNHDWRANSQIIRLKIAAHIKNHKAAETFAKLLETEKELGARVTYLQKNITNYTMLDEESQKYLDSILSNIERVGNDLKELVTVIANEARSDVKESGKL